MTRIVTLSIGALVTVLASPTFASDASLPAATDATAKLIPAKFETSSDISPQQYDRLLEETNRVRAYQSAQSAYSTTYNARTQPYAAYPATPHTTQSVPQQQYYQATQANNQTQQAVPQAQPQNPQYAATAPYAQPVQPQYQVAPQGSSPQQQAAQQNAPQQPYTYYSVTQPGAQPAPQPYQSAQNAPVQPPVNAVPGYAQTYQAPQPMSQQQPQQQPQFQYQNQQPIQSQQPLAPQQNLQASVLAAPHFVAKGDTLYSLSKRYNVTLADLRAANNVQGNTIYVGQALRIPTRALMGAPTMAPTNSALPYTYQAPNPPMSVVYQNNGTQVQTNRVRSVQPVPSSRIYAVLPNDTLLGIAEFACVDAGDLAILNGLTTYNATLAPGRRLTIPANHCLG